MSVDTFLAGLAAALRQHPVAAGQGRVWVEAVMAADRIDLPWAQRLALLREHVLGRMPVLVVLDDFDDNLAAGPGRWTVRDPALGCLLASSAGAPHPVRLLITGPCAGCRPGGFAAIDRYPSDMGANVIAAGPPCDPRTLPFGERRSQSRRLTVRRDDVGA